MEKGAQFSFRILRVFRLLTYDALRSATVERRAAWLSDLEALPNGPRKNAAFSSFFKTLVQLDAREAISLVDRLQGKHVRQVASDAMFKAAPASAMPEMAAFLLRNNLKTNGIEGHLGEAIEEWSRVDPVAVSLFLDQHAGSQDLRWCFDSLLFQWARLDPESAKTWFYVRPHFLRPKTGSAICQTP